MRRTAALLVVVMMTTACATLGSLRSFVQAPRFERAGDHTVDVRLVPPSPGNVLGGANIRLWTKVTNPNPFGLTLASLTGTLFLDDARAATTEFPLGVPLQARGESVIPIDVAVSFAELPGLASVIRRAARREPVEYHLEGTVGVDAGALGQPVFGPMTFVRGTIE